MGATGAGCLAPKRQTNISIVLTQLRLSGQAIASALLALDRSGGYPAALGRASAGGPLSAQGLHDSCTFVYCLRFSALPCSVAVLEGT